VRDSYVVREKSPIKETISFAKEPYKRDSFAKEPYKRDAVMF